MVYTKALVRAFDRSCARPGADLAGEVTGLSGGVAATVIPQPLDGSAAAAVLDRGGHEIAHILGR